jgi:catechol 2,3-dioxygenase-like lactoylglutathione lyase family enzyme
MRARITVITLGVDDLDKALRFYRDGLGLETPGIIGQQFEHGAVAFFKMQPGLMLAVWPRDSIAHDAGIPRSSRSPTELTIGHNLRTRDEVDLVMEQARAAGARIVKSAVETFWGGYAGYFQDPDGHLWEVLWNPDLVPDD